MMQQRRRSVFWSLAAAVGMAFAMTGSLASPAAAEGGNIGFKVVSGYQAGEGGEFSVDVFTGIALPPFLAGVPSAEFKFETFCIEHRDGILPNEAATYVTSKFVDNDLAQPLSPAAAYLYSQFWNGTLSGYDYAPGAGRASSAQSLQLALWVLQGQLPATVLDGAGQDFVDDAVSANWQDVQNVRVMVVTRNDGRPRQDLLVLLPVTNPSPSLRLTKSAASAIVPSGGTDIDVAPFATVTYSYTVTNTGSVPLTNVVVKDKSDQGTPLDPTDDVEFTVGEIASLPVAPNPLSTQTLTASLVLPVKLCATLSTGADVNAGTMLISTLPPTAAVPEGSLKVTYIQSEGLNDNRYGTGATAATGWSGGHSFKNLVGSDKLEFRFTNKSGATVLDFYMDTITGVASETFPSGTVSYPSLYGTRGANGAEGSLESGSLSNLLLVQTSISENLIKYPVGYLVNSPAETAPLSGISADAAAPLWDYKNSYTAIVRGSTFGAGGLADFGSVVVPDQHNSPAKQGGHSAIPSPCDWTVCNVATASATANGVPAAATATSNKVCVTIKTGTGGPTGGPAKIEYVASSTKDKKLFVDVKNTGGSVATISAINITWPSGNKKLNKIKNGKPTIFDAGAAASNANINAFKGKLTERQIPAGGTVRLTFEFETNISSNLSLYDLKIDIGAGAVEIL